MKIFNSKYNWRIIYITYLFILIVILIAFLSLLFLVKIGFINNNITDVINRIFIPIIIIAIFSFVIIMLFYKFNVDMIFPSSIDSIIVFV